MTEKMAKRVKETRSAYSAAIREAAERDILDALKAAWTAALRDLTTAKILYHAR